VLRLWVASTDYANEISVSDEILKRTSDSYRRIRNTARFLLGNLAGFDPARDAVPVNEMVALDRWALARARALQEEIVAAYRELRLPPDLPEGAQLLRRRPRRLLSRRAQGPLYTMPAGSVPRRSAQTAMLAHRRGDGALAGAGAVVHGEEIWGYLPAQARGVGAAFGPGMQLPEVPPAVIDWPALIALRSDVLRELERCARLARSARRSRPRSSCYARPTRCRELGALGDELRFLLITSEAAPRRRPAAGADAPAMRLPAAVARRRLEACGRHRRAEMRALLAPARRRGPTRRIRSSAGAASPTSNSAPARRGAHERRREGGASRPKSGWRWLPPWLAHPRSTSSARAGSSGLRALRVGAVLPVLDITALHNYRRRVQLPADAGGWQRWASSGARARVSAGMVVWLRGVPRARSCARGGPGADPGRCDRQRHRPLEHGYVVDFIHAHWGAAYFPAFNVADAAITVGAGLLLLDAFLEWRREGTRK
jgi:hypothetical protein